jgi:hypothetical protein
MAVLPACAVLGLGTGLSVARAESAAALPFRLVVETAPAPGAPSALDPGKLRSDLERELGRPIIVGAEPAPDAGVVTIAYRGAANELTVAFVAPGRETLTRTILPPAGEDVAALAVLLAGNLMRDQAGELLGPPAAPIVVPIASGPPRQPEASLVAESPAEEESDGDAGWLARVHPGSDIWTGNLSLLNIGLRLAVERGYLLLSASGHQENGRRMAGGGLAFGVSLPYGQFACELDVGATYMRGLDKLFPPPPQGPNSSVVYYTNSRLISRVRASVVFHAHPLFSVFVGSAYAVTTHFYGVIDNDYGPELFAGVRI